MAFEYDFRGSYGSLEISLPGLVSGFFGLAGPAIEFDLDEDFDVPAEKPVEISR